MSKINVKEDKDNKIKISFLDMWKQFWNPEPEELTEEETILTDEELSDEEKKELIKALRNTEKMENIIFQNSYKKANLKVEAKESAKQALKQNSKEMKKEIEERDDIIR